MKTKKVKSLPRVTRRIKVGPSAVDYNWLMGDLEKSGRKLLLLTPRYGLFGNLKGYFAYVSYSADDEKAFSTANVERFLGRKMNKPWWYWFIIDHWFRSCDHPLCNRRVRDKE